MIRVGTISYLNSIPFIYGLKKSNLISKINLLYNFPANSAKSLINNEVDVALIPSAALKFLDNYSIITDFCIGAEKEVDSVCVYSNVDIKNVKEIILDYQSNTSVELLKIIIKDYWNISPKLVSSSKGYEQNIKGSTAALVIGDRAFALNGKYKYTYDLASIWNTMTDLPFVFACWVSTIQLSDIFEVDFNNALKIGVNNIDLAIKEEGRSCVSDDPVDYLNNKISYNFDARKKESLKLFLSKIS
jgi:chorismate dehydratase